MCLAIPGRIIEIVDADLQLARVEIGGVRRSVHIGLVQDDGAAPGDWVLVHVGFAISRIDEAEAAYTLRALEQIGNAYRQEIEEIRCSEAEGASLHSALSPLH